MAKKMFETETVTCDTEEEFKQVEEERLEYGWTLIHKRIQPDGSIRAQFELQINPMRQLADRLRNKK